MSDDGLGARLRAGRQRRGLSLTDASRDICSASYLSLIEAGKRAPSAKVLRALCARLDLAEPATASSTVGAAFEAVEVAFAAGDFEAVARLLDREPESAQAWLFRGMLFERTGNAPAAIEYYSRAWESSAASASVRLRAATGLCRVLRDSGAITSAISVGDQALASLRADGGDGAVHADVEYELRAVLASVYCETGDLARALRLTRIDEVDAVPTLWQQVTSLWTRASVLQAAGDFAESAEVVHTALNLLQDQARPLAVARLGQTAAWLELQSEQPDLPAVRARLEHAEAQFRIQGFDTDLAYCLSTRAELHAREGDVVQTKAAIGEALQLLAGQDGIRGSVLAGAAEAYAALGLVDDAHAALLEARRLLEPAGASRSAAITWRRMAALHEELGEPDLALACMKAATDLLGLGAHVAQRIITRA